MSQDESQNTPLPTETTENSSSVTMSIESEHSCPDFAPIDSTSHDLNGVQQLEVHQRQLSLNNIQQPNCEVYPENVGQIISAGGESSDPWPEEQPGPGPEESSDPRSGASFTCGADAFQILDDQGRPFPKPRSVIQPQGFSFAGIPDPKFRQQQTTLLNTIQTDHAGAQICNQQQKQDPAYPNKGHVLATATNSATAYTPNQSYLVTEDNTRNVAIADTAINATPTEAPSSISHLIASQRNQSERNDGSKKKRLLCHNAGCHRIFEEPYQLEEHLLNYPHDKKYVCRFCGIRFRLIKKYEKHRKTHGGDGTLNIATASTSSTSTSIESSSSSSGSQLNATGRNRQCDCSECKRIRSDIEEKTWEFVCDIPGCNYVCFTTASVKEHKRKHTGERSVVCEICRKGFASKKGLKEHQKRYADACNPKTKQNVATVTNPVTVSTPSQTPRVTERSFPHIVFLHASTVSTVRTPNEISHVAESGTHDVAVAGTSTTAATVSTPNQISQVTECETPDTSVADTSKTATTVTTPLTDSQLNALEKIED